MNKKRYLFLFVVIVFCACQISSSQDMLELTGDYTIQPVSSPSQQLQIKIEKPSDKLLFEQAGKFNVSINKTIPNNFVNTDLILMIGKVGEAVEANWNDSLVGTCGSLSPLFRIENWKNSLFYIPASINTNKEVNLTFIIENNSKRGGFYNRIPSIIKLQNFIKNNQYLPYTPKTDAWKPLVENIISQLSGDTDLSFEQLKLKNDYKLFGEFPQHIEIQPLGKTENNGASQYLFQIEMDYQSSKRIFIDELFLQNGELIKQPFYLIRDYYKSDILSEERVFGVYLPPDYYTNKNKKYPVIYAFGGGSEIYGTLVNGRLDQIYNDLILSKKVEPFILIGTQGSRGSRFLVEPLTGKNLEKSFIQELIPCVESKYRVNENTCGIIGLSNGGTAAMSFGLRYPDRFKAVVSVSGVLHRPQKEYVEKNPFYIVSNTQQKIKQNIFITCGNSDELGLNKVAEEFHSLLQTKGMDHKYVLFDGGHHHDEWYQMIPEIFSFFQTHFQD